MNRRTYLSVPVALAALACCLAAPAGAAEQPKVAGGEGIKFSEYYDPPHETQIKWLMECAQAQRQPDGRVLATQVKYRTYSVTNEAELVVQAPECVYDPERRTINSPGTFHAQKADGSFTIEGEGFLWQQTNSTLLVSNRVHTTLHPELFGPQAATPLTNRPATTLPPLDVFSDQFEYGQTTGRAAYQGNVHVTGTNLNATAARLDIRLPLEEHRLQSLTAEKGVVVDYQQIHATGDWAFYSEDTGLVQLKGQPTWRMGPREGSGDELTLDRTNKVFRSTGHARLLTPSTGMGGAAFLSQPGAARTNAPAATNEFIEVLCDNYMFQTNLAVFRKDVRVTDRRAEQVQGNMTCGLMTLTFHGTNEFEKLVAEGGVVIAQGERRFTAARADCNGTNSLLDLTGNPVWYAGTREGRGDTMRMNLAREEMLVQGNASMRLPASEVGRSTLTGLGAAKPAKPKESLTGFAEIRSQEYLVTRESALFTGGVHIEAPQMKWSSDELTMLTPPELGKEGRMLIAEPFVVFDMQDDKGRNFHGTGRKAVYTRRSTATLTNDLIELTGTPAIITATNRMGYNHLIRLDLGNHTIVAPGRYHLQGVLPPSATNMLRAPKLGRAG
jgi:lipopolysaccharide export system protein LptA